MMSRLNVKSKKNDNILEFLFFQTNQVEWMGLFN